MEPERKIEKLLRAYAQKRRAAAGDPLKLHPATRRLLQDEVSRRAPKPEPFKRVRQTPLRVATLSRVISVSGE